MSYAKPNKHLVMPKEKSIYTVNGFVDAFNWMLAVLMNMKGSAEGKTKPGIKIKWQESDKPVFELENVKADVELIAGSGITITTNADGSKTISAHYV